MNEQAALMPTDVSSRVGFFDRFAGRASNLASRAPFFAACVLLVVVWLLQGVLVVLLNGDLASFLNAKYQLEINTTTTIVTFLLVAVLQNSQTRNDQATQHKLNAIADALADLMSNIAEVHDREPLRNDIRELQAAVGLESKEGTSENEAA